MVCSSDVSADELRDDFTPDEMLLEEDIDVNEDIKDIEETENIDNLDGDDYSDSENIDNMDDRMIEPDSAKFYKIKRALWRGADRWIIGNNV